MDPDDVRQPGDLRMVQRWLAGRMSGTLVDCTAAARARQAGVCDLDREYPGWLDRYVDVAGETAMERDDAAASGFRDARRNQARFNDRVREFRETYDEYQEAREAGDTERARELARRLLELQPRVTNASNALVGDYRVISNATGANLADSAATVEAVEGNVTATTEDVAADLFVETTLTVTAADSRVSFDDPLRLSGRLRTDDGAPLAGRTVTLVVGDRRLETTTDDTGRFALSYRPTTLRTDVDAVRVRYDPRNDSVYLPASARVPVTVDQVRPTVTVARTPATVGFVDALTVRGRVAANGTGAAGVPVTVTLGGVRIGATRTAADGRYVVRGLVPAAVASGSRSVRATVPLEDRALAETSNATPVTVTTTPTTVTVNGTAVGPRTVRVRGRLATADGTPVPGQPVTVAVAGERVTTITAGQGGQYGGRVTVPSDVPANATVTVAVQYRDEGTNLGPSRAETTVSLPAATEDVNAAGMGPIGMVALAALVALGGLVVLLGGYAFVTGARPWRSSSIGDWAQAVGLVGSDDGDADAVSTDDDATSTATASTEGPAADDPAPPTEATTPTLVEYAREQVETGDPDRGVVAAYVATRRALADRVGDEATRTHWEFFEHATSALDENERNRLRTLTEAFERAAFASTSASRDDARDVVTAATAFLDA
ncbi:MAG: DUF4129 domain-containing protein [Haloferacaceae archaeon]